MPWLPADAGRHGSCRGAGPPVPLPVSPPSPRPLRGDRWRPKASCSSPTDAPPAPTSLASSFPPQSGGKVPVGNMASHRPPPPGVNCLQRGVTPPFYLAHSDSRHSAAPPWTLVTTAALKCRQEGRRFTTHKETRLLQVSGRRDRIKTSCGPAHPGLSVST